MSEAERLAKWHDAMASEPKRNEAKRKKHQATASELRRLSAELEALKKAIGWPVGHFLKDFAGETGRWQQCKAEMQFTTPLYALTKDQS